MSKSHKKRTNNGFEDLEFVEKVQPKNSPLTVEKAQQKVNKLIIKNDTEDEEELRKEVERSTPQSQSRQRKRSNVSPIKFDIKVEADSSTSLVPVAKRSSSSSSLTKLQHHESDDATKPKRVKNTSDIREKISDNPSKRSRSRDRSHDNYDDDNEAENFEHDKSSSYKDRASDHRVNIKRSDVSRKYENLPPRK